MGKFFIILLFIFAGRQSGYIRASEPVINAFDKECYYNGHRLYTGNKGGCYYYNKNNNKTYVDRKYCHC